MSVGQRHLFSWLHLSDLHFGHGDVAHRWDQRAVLEQLAADVRQALASWPELPRPGAVMVTGDIAFSGAARKPDEYTAATTFFDQLASTLEISKENIYLVPGNHDVQRGVAADLIERIRKEPAALDDILATASQCTMLLGRLANFRSFAGAFAARDLVGWSHSIPIPDFGDITLVGINTALVSHDDADRGRLILSSEQRDLLSKPGGAVRLLLTHHPFDAEWMHDELLLRSKAQVGTTIHLCGHVHDPRAGLSAETGSGPHVRVVAAAAHRDQAEAKAGKESHGYNFASLMLDAGGNLKLRIWPRRWFPHWSSFRVDHMGVLDRSFHDDKLLKAGYAGSGLVLEEATDLRMVGVHWWGKGIRWGELLRGKTTLDVFGIAVVDLFAQQDSYVKSFLDRGGKVRVVLADPFYKPGMARYDEDFDRPLGHRCGKVLEALKVLARLRREVANDAALEVRVTRRTFKYSAYRLDGDVLFVPYAMVPGKDPVRTPALIFDKRSSIVVDFVSRDLDGLIKGSPLLTTQELEDILKAAG